MQSTVKNNAFLPYYTHFLFSYLCIYSRGAVTHLCIFALY